jgi:hypothetical protein
MSFNICKIAQISAIATVALTAAVVAAPTQASAFELNGWDYATGGKNNGTGGAVFDYQGLAVKESADSITIAINSGMDLNGKSWNGSHGTEIINHGDLFFNFTGKSFKEASDAGELMAVNFAQLGSQTGAATTGVYANVKAKSTATYNYGWNNVNAWSNAVGGNNSYGDLSSSSSYFAGQQTGSNKILNAIGTGTKVGDIMMLSTNQLTAAGLNFAASGAQGAKTVGFTFQKTPGFKLGAFVANLFMECGNDGAAISSKLTKKAPEPAFMTGMAIVGGLGLLRRRRRQG